MRLLELFDKVAEWGWDKTVTHSRVAKFQVGDRPYYIQFDKDTFDPDCLDMFNFENENAVICDVTFYMAGKRPRGKNSVDITGTGKAYEVFATVKHIIDSFVNTNSGIDYLHFEASEESRIKLYDRFVSTYPGQVEQRGWRDDPGGISSMHYLVKL
jgi:hypothetical protein